MELLPGWPERYVHVHDVGLPPALLASLQGDAGAVADAPNYWIPRARLLGAPPAQMTPVEAAVRHLLTTLVADMLPDNWQGAEFWVQVYQPGKGLAFHFDKDESLLVTEGRTVNPILSSVLYLTGSTQAGSRREGPTVVIDQVFDSQQGRPMPDEPQRCVLAYPHAGRYLTFDGRLGHGVLDSFSRSVRATLLVNWWAHQPQAVHELSAADVAKFGWSLLGDTDASNASSSAAQQPAGAPSSADGCGRGDHGAASPGAAEERLGSVVSDLAAVQLQDSCRAVELPIQQLAVPADEQEAVLVDEVLRDAGVGLTGGAACSAVAIDHIGYVMCPLDAEQDLDPELQTAAVFILASMLSDSGSEGASTD